MHKVSTYNSKLLGLTANQAFDKVVETNQPNMLRAYWQIIAPVASPDTDVNYLFLNAKESFGHHERWFSKSLTVSALTGNEHTPADVLEEIYAASSRSISPEGKGNAAAHRDAPPSVLDAALKSKNSTTRLFASTSLNMTVDQMKSMKDDKCVRVRMSVAGHRKATEEVLLLYVQDSHFRVKISAMESPAVTEKVVGMALADADKRVRNFAVNHSLAPLDVFIKSRVERMIKSIVSEKEGGEIYELCVRAKLKEIFNDE